VEASSGEQRRRDRLEAAFVDAERQAQMTAVRVILPALLVVAAWVTWENGFPEVLFYYAFIAAFGLLLTGPMLFWRIRRVPHWERYLRFSLGVALYTVLSLTPNPLAHVEVRSAAMFLRWQNELYLFLFLAGSVFTYSPRVVLMTGVSAAFCWTLAALWVLQMPGVFSGVPLEKLATMSLQEQRWALMDPNRVFVNGVVRVDLTLLLTAVTLAAFVRRSRQIVAREAEVERQRSNLSRYFSPNMVDELAESDLPLASTRRQDVAVLFTDIVGFTAMSARAEPELVIETLRQFHQRVEAAVFARGGTLEKYIGDAVMATFGTPRPGTEDATNALRCVRALLDTLDELNRERGRRGFEPIRAGIGVHYGAVVLGDIGGEHRLEFAVVGDTVNVASRLERLTRDLDAAVVVSGELVEAALREGADLAALLPELREAPSRAVRGREQPVRLWIQPRDLPLARAQRG